MIINGRKNIFRFCSTALILIVVFFSFSPTTVHALEAQILNRLINQQRTANDLQPLLLDDQLHQLASARAGYGTA